MANYDLTGKLAQFFDAHLVIPLLEFIGPLNIYNGDSLLKMNRAILLRTNMIDGAIDTYPEGEIPKELLERKELILQEREIIASKCERAVEIIEHEDVKELMESPRDREGNSKVLEYVQQKYGFQVEMLENLFKYAKFQYECGNYNPASVCLYYYRNLVPQHDTNYLGALYGKLASEILCEEWIHAKDDLSKLRAYVDSEPFDTEQELLQHRAWLLHWSLFVFFNSPKGRDEVVEMFLNQQPYLNTIQIICPHLLRYVAVAVVSSKSKQKSSLKDLIKVIEADRANYNDPVTDFLSCLYIDFDFEAAQTKLRECESVLSNDFFLTNCLEEFRECARLLIFEMFCRIHQCVSLDMLSKRLNMEKADAERWIVDLIRNFRIEGAKIDLQLGQVVMGTKSTSIYEQVIESTKRLTFRSQQIALQLQKLKTDKKGQWKADQQS